MAKYARAAQDSQLVRRAMEIGKLKWTRRALSTDEKREALAFLRSRRSVEKMKQILEFTRPAKEAGVEYLAPCTFIGPDKHGTVTLVGMDSAGEAVVLVGKRKLPTRRHSLR